MIYDLNEIANPTPSPLRIYGWFVTSANEPQDTTYEPV